MITVILTAASVIGAPAESSASLTPAPAPLNEEVFLSCLLRELYARWPIAPDADLLAIHRGLVQLGVERSAPNEVLHALFERQRALSEQFTDMLVRLGRLDASTGRGARVAWPEGRLSRGIGANPYGQIRDDLLALAATWGGDAPDEVQAFLAELETAWDQTAETLAPVEGDSSDAVRHVWAFRDTRSEVEIESHPNDPFALFCAIQYPFPEERAEESARAARLLSRAASLIPPDAVYAGLRTDLHARATSLGLFAASRVWMADLEPGKAPEDPLPGASELVEICRARLADQESAPARYELALALGFAGRVQDAARAFDEAQAALTMSAEQLYEGACLAARAGQPDRALERLGACFASSTALVSWSRIDPDLGSLRESRGEAFADLTEVRWSWSVEPERGVVRLRNESSFDLHELHLRVQLDGGAGAAVEHELVLPSLSAGETATWDVDWAPAVTAESSASLSSNEI